MSVEVEKLEKNMAKLTIEVPAEDFTAALEKAYKAERNKFDIPGFRKGKAPRRIVQQFYGSGIFYEDAANSAVQEAYPAAAQECGEPIVSRPTIDIVQIEEGKPFIFTAEVALKPEVTLGEYKGVEIEKVPCEVTDEDVDNEIAGEREQNARMIDIDDRPVENGDTINFDFDGTIDGEPFEGGKSTDYSLTVGSGSFIPGFEEQLVGKNIGEDFDVNVTFPEDYQAEDLKGKDAVFACRINSISVKELPDLDDEFAQDVSEFDTFEEYKADVRKNLEETKKTDAKREKENRAVAKAVENASMEIPDPMIDDEAEEMMDEFANNLQYQGMTLDLYLQYLGMTADDLMEQMKPEALRRIKDSLVLETIAKEEDIQVSDERLDEDIKKMADSYQMEADEMKKYLSDDQLRQMKDDIAVQCAVELIADAAVEVEAEEKEEEKPKKKAAAKKKKKTAEEKEPEEDAPADEADK